ncbi:MAG TPA: hypothetical protein VNV85_15085 [Puia sp.]|jgi:hypothetical protein|nr:hypothetical protein [Puia sp.]
MTFHAQIENGYLTGYEMLHGTKGTVGDFHVEGTATLKDDRVIYDITAIWNDIKNPNPIYKDDIVYSKPFVGSSCNGKQSNSN